MLAGRKHWVFDLDGTLTLAVHDFDALRRELGLPSGLPILEALQNRPEEEVGVLMRRLDALEADLVSATGPAPGAADLLRGLSEQCCKMGVLTRNSLENARATLVHCGLSHRFDPADVLGRAEASPKPSPDGILQLLRRWGASPRDAVMIGDFRYDLEAGRAAGVATVSVDASGQHEWASLADVCVDTLSELLSLANDENR
ncbi:MAG: HAD family hydrolase [Planctomycetota bacterium]|nr:HAD family hydrolase [Planctomycetota bacterium]